jgi:hypothetical protein
MTKTKKKNVEDAEDRLSVTYEQGINLWGGWRSVKQVTIMGCKDLVKKIPYIQKGCVPIYTFFIDSVLLDFTISETEELVQFTLSSGTLNISNLSAEKDLLKKYLLSDCQDTVQRIYNIARRLYAVYVEEIEKKYRKTLKYDQRNAVERAVRCVLEFTLNEGHPKIDFSN